MTDQKKKPAKDSKARKGTGTKNPGPSLVFYALIVFVFAFILYGNTLHHSYALDDAIVSKGNEFVQKGFGGIPDIFSHGFLSGFNHMNDQSYRPVPLLTMAVETGIWGENPGTHHFFNVLYYALACVLILLLLRKMLPAFPPLIPLLVVLLFTAHPIHTEAVANFKSRDEVLNFLFLAGMLYALFRYLESGKMVWYILAPSAFFLALLTKEQAVTFLVLIPLVLYYFTETSRKKILVSLIPFMAMALLYIFIRWSVLDVMTFKGKMTIDNNALASTLSHSARLATAILILGRYLLLLFFPHPLSYDYSYNQIPIVSFSNIWVIITLLVFLAWGVYAVYRIRTKDVHGFSFFFFVITMSVVSNIFILIGSTLGERFLLTPSFVFCISILFITGKILRTDLHSVTLQKKIPFLAVIGLILLLYSVKTIARNADWKDNLTLFEADVVSAPNSMRTHSALGYEYFSLFKSAQDPAEKQSYYEKAASEFERSIEICPENNYALYNYGVMQYNSGKLNEAVALYLKAVKVDSNDCNSWNDLSVITFQQAQYDSSLFYFSKLLRCRPDDPKVLEALGVIHARKQEYGKAVEFYKKALSLDPSRELTYNNLIQVLTIQGDTAGVRFYTEQKKRNLR